MPAPMMRVGMLWGGAGGGGARDMVGEWEKVSGDELDFGD